MILYLGIDPGAMGAWAAITEDGSYFSSGLCPDSIQGMANELWAQALSKYPCRATVELVGARPGQGVCSMFNFGKNWGVWLGILAAHQISYSLVTPQKWMKEVLDSPKKGDMLHLEFARRHWPDAPLGRKKDEGVAAALCISEYGRRNHA